MATNSGIQRDTDTGILALMSYNRNLAESLASGCLRYLVRVNNHAIHQKNIKTNSGSIVWGNGFPLCLACSSMDSVDSCG